MIRLRHKELQELLLDQKIKRLTNLTL